jgi:hypothetical protein
VYLPNFIMTDELQHEKLLKTCLGDKELRQYIPELGDINGISREFLISVLYCI